MEPMDFFQAAVTQNLAINLIMASPNGDQIITYFEDIDNALNDEPWAREHRKELRRDALRASVTPKVNAAMKDKLAEIRLPKALLDLEIITREEFRDIVKYIRFGY